MGKMFRINELELKELEKKTREINKKLVSKNLVTLKDTEVLHAVFIDAVKKITVSENGKIILKDGERGK